MAARLRHDRWIEQLTRFREQGAEHKSKAAFLKSQLTGWRTVIPVLQEVLLAEPLAHCVAAFATKLDERGIDTELIGVAQRVLDLHQEARKRCLHLMVFGQGLPVETAVELNRVRRNIDNYTESLKGIITRGCDTIHFRQVDVARFLTTTQYWQLRKSTAHNIDWRCCSPHWNSEIVRSTLGLIDGDVFDSFGTLKSPSVAWNATAGDSTGHNNDLATRGATEDPATEPQSR